MSSNLIDEAGNGREFWMPDSKGDRLLPVGMQEIAIPKGEKKKKMERYGLYNGFQKN